MLTRAYDAAMAAYQTPTLLVSSDFDTSSVSDALLNCRNYTGVIRNLFSPMIVQTNGNISSATYSAYYIPFAYFGYSNYTCIYPDEDATPPNYEDFRVTNSAPAGWVSAGAYPVVTKEFDSQAGEIVTSIKMSWKNTTGSDKTVYGLSCRFTAYYRSSYSTMTTSTDTFLACREHFDVPVVVPANDIIDLNLTLRVGRLGITAVSASA